jgi:hypothetical protein
MNYPGNGEDFVAEWYELEEAIRALKDKPHG